MTARLDPNAVAPEAMKAMLALETYVRNSSLERSLVELVKIRASQVNGCAYCIDMHVRDARAHGESERRLHLLAAWRESSLFGARERAALAWAEALTLVAETRAPDDVYAEARRHFTERELVDLTILVATINGWNRIAVGFRSQHPAEKAAA
jgi:AhpD family alkylhydroperoxidase